MSFERWSFGSAKVIKSFNMDIIENQVYVDVTKNVDDIQGKKAYLKADISVQNADDIKVSLYDDFEEKPLTPPAQKFYQDFFKDNYALPMTELLGKAETTPTLSRDENGKSVISVDLNVTDRNVYNLIARSDMVEAYKQNNSKAKVCDVYNEYYYLTATAKFTPNEDMPKYKVDNSITLSLEHKTSGKLAEYNVPMVNGEHTALERAYNEKFGDIHYQLNLAENKYKKEDIEPKGKGWFSYDNYKSGIQPLMFPPKVGDDGVTFEVHFPKSFEDYVQSMCDMTSDMPSEFYKGLIESDFDHMYALKADFKDNGEVSYYVSSKNENGEISTLEVGTSADHDGLKQVYDEKLRLDLEDIHNIEDELVSENGKVSAILSPNYDTLMNMAARTDIPVDYGIMFENDFRNLLAQDNVQMTAYADFAKNDVEMTVTINVDNDFREYNVPITNGEKERIRESLEQTYGKDALAAEFENAKDKPKPVERD